jgi:hypothetical protein
VTRTVLGRGAGLNFGVARLIIAGDPVDRLRAASTSSAVAALSADRVNQCLEMSSALERINRMIT